jgi:hypothetical protein
VGLVQGFSRRVDALSSLSSIRKMKWCRDGEGALVERLERRDMAVPPDEHRPRTSQGVWQLWQRLPGRSVVVSSGRMFGSIQCLRKLHKKFY